MKILKYMVQSDGKIHLKSVLYLSVQKVEKVDKVDKKAANIF